MKQPCHLLLCLLLCLLLGVSGCSVDPAVRERQRFDQYVDQCFVKALSEDYHTMALFLENPREYGIDPETVPATLGPRFSQEEFRRAEENAKEQQARLQSFQRGLLTPGQQTTYDLMARQNQLQVAMSQERFDYLGSLFGSINGLHVSLPTFFTEYPLRSERDVKALIQTVEDVAPYLQSALDYTSLQAEKGLLMLSPEDVAQECRKTVSMGMDSSVLDEMERKLDALGLGEKGEGYKAQLEEAFSSSYLAGYEQVAAFMEQLDQSGGNTGGLCRLENGREGYELMVQSATGSARSVEETQELMLEQLERHTQALYELLLDSPGAYELLAQEGLATHYISYEEMLADLEELMQEDFPDIGRLEYTVSPISQETANDSVAAYFPFPAIDGQGAMSIKVNSSLDRADLQEPQSFFTIAHEGLPGHMYQISYAYQTLQAPYRKVLASELPGYSEGYATYVELLAYDYLKEAEPELDGDALDLLRQLTLCQNDLVALCDMGIHYQGWDLEELNAFTLEQGWPLGDPSLLYQQLQDNPAVFLSYYVGYTEFALLKEKAQEELGEQFDPKAFHQAILENGPLPFELLEEKVKDFLRQAAQDAH